MSWLTQARVFFSEIKMAKNSEENEVDVVHKGDLEFVSSASEARLLAVPQGASFLIILAVFATIALILWASIMEVDEIAKAHGKVIPSKHVQLIQSLEGGIVKEINVIEGQAVQVGDVLVVIDDVYAQSDVDENANSYNALLARFVSLTARLKNKESVEFPEELQSHVKIITQERERFNARRHKDESEILELEFSIKQKHQEYESAVSEKRAQDANYKLSVQEMVLNEPLLKSGAISKVEYLHIRQKTNESLSRLNHANNNVPKMQASLSEAMQKRESYIHEAKYQDEKERNELQAKLNTMSSKGVSLQAKLSHSVISSPVVGIVKKINFNTVGGVIRSGMDIMEIVPTDDKLLIEVEVKPKDIGFISAGLPAVVKVTAFDFSTYGGLEGVVTFISADTITDKKGNSFYLSRIRTKSNILKDKNNEEHAIIPGMKTEVRIVLDKKSILSYILNPMLK
ncbi:MAG: HlyD family type I secretion periplasmic adaptor subunit [Candidatus Endonucleobacter bathymodioli]|uniref:Membrane fusion protein (MFP) family protein n=1 Tax=Candidatus Endonucleibacter bathymodioli TaxID=539814 RepID=A0AA90SMV8_9GAMM|nr:HlyD family type I secretion periplasmic adaptor subunit [Candidatus Endonucleobacter bathymodioli]